MVIVVLVLLLLLAVFYGLYVSLIKKKNHLKEASSDIDVQLKKRYDLIPNILNMASKFMDHEKTLMTEIVELRSKAMTKTFVKNPTETMELENQLEGKLRDFWLNVENYPDLKSNQTMVQAMQTFNEVEEHIAAARRFYNAAAADLKNAVEIFPSSFVAKMIGINNDIVFIKAPDEAVERIDAMKYFK